MVSMSRITSEGNEKKTKKRVLMKDWLIDKLNTNSYPGNIEWVDKALKLFKINWLHASTESWSEQHAIIFKDWSLHTGKYDPRNEVPKRWKANFRCALNSLPDVRWRKELSIKKGKDAFRVFQILDNSRRRLIRHKPDRSSNRPGRRNSIAVDKPSGPQQMEQTFSSSCGGSPLDSLPGSAFRPGGSPLDLLPGSAFRPGGSPADSLPGSTFRPGGSSLDSLPGSTFRPTPPQQYYHQLHSYGTPPQIMLNCTTGQPRSYSPISSVGSVGASPRWPDPESSAPHSPMDLTRGAQPETPLFECKKEVEDTLSWDENGSNSSNVSDMTDEDVVEILFEIEEEAYQGMNCLHNKGKLSQSLSVPYMKIPPAYPTFLHGPSYSGQVLLDISSPANHCYRFN